MPKGRAWLKAAARRAPQVATVAFGMGIDNPRVRLVVHWDVPMTLDGFSQASPPPEPGLKPGLKPGASAGNPKGACSRGTPLNAIPLDLHGPPWAA